VLAINAVNFFLGIGLPWVVGAGYWDDKYDERYDTEMDEVVWSIILYVSFLLLTLLILFFRSDYTGGELGGSYCARGFWGFVLMLFWAAFVVLVSLHAYEVLPIDIQGIVKKIEGEKAVIEPEVTANVAPDLVFTEPDPKPVETPEENAATVDEPASQPAESEPAPVNPEPAVTP